MWTVTAWQFISPEVNVKGGNKCCISSVLNETDDDMLWNGSEEDEDVRSECEEDEGIECEDWSQWQWLVKANTTWHAIYI